MPSFLKKYKTADTLAKTVSGTSYTKSSVKKKLILFLVFLSVSLNLYSQEIDTIQVIEIGKIKQSVNIKGNKNNPILLYLHGGPGAASSRHRDQITNLLEQDYLVVHWDQRESGNTLKLNSSDTLPTLSIMKQDAEEVLMFLLKEFDKKNILIVANSWGTVLGFHLAETYPDKIQALIAISPLVDLNKSQKLVQRKLLNYYKKKGNITAINELKSISIPYESIEDMAIQFKWITDFKGEKMSDEDFQSYYSYFKDWGEKWMSLYKELYQIKLLKQLPVLHCPTYIFIGNQDLTTSFEFTEKFYNKLKAPEKELYWFEGIGHQIPMYEPQKMQNVIKDILMQQKL